MTLKTLATPGDTEWFTHDRFGLFIHWGAYALGARHEWLQHQEEIPGETYHRKYFEHFDPDLYDPAEWARLASNAGMKYFVITTKHHEGFCLWDSKHTDYKAPNTPCGRDLLRPMVEAFRAENMRVGFYHSLIDWHHPKYHIDPHIGPYRNSPDRQKMNKTRDQKKYAAYLNDQVRELLTEFGLIDILWCDFSFATRPEGKGQKDWQSKTLYRTIRELMPNIVLNDRLDLDSGWDIKTPEQVQPREWVRVNGKPVVWEACQTFSGSWGYHREEQTWKSLDLLVKMLIDTVSKGGNLLLNVGPTGRGEFDSRARDRLAGMGEWMRRHSRSIYGCTQAPKSFKCPEDCRFTYNPDSKRLYLHVFSWPFKKIYLDGMGDRVEYSQLLNDASEIGMEANADDKSLVLNIPTVPPATTVPVIELYLKG